jgi:hypothetical protein
MKICGSGGIPPTVLTSARDGVIIFMPLLLYPLGKALGAHWVRSWVVPMVGLNAVEKRKILRCRTQAIPLL